MSLQVVVLDTGLEPASRETVDFESTAFAYFANPAYRIAPPKPYQQKELCVTQTTLCPSLPPH